jgi:hypothetical protein
MAATQPDRRPGLPRRPNQPGTPLDEIHRRLVAIHYPLAEAGRIDQELHVQTLQRLMDLINYVDDAISTQDSTRS